MVAWRRRLLAFGLCIGLLLFSRQVWVSLKAIQQGEVALVRPQWLLASLACGVLVFALQLLAWVLIMRFLQVSLPPRQVLRGFYLSFLPRYIPGSVWGYWSRSEWLEQEFGVTYGVSVMGSVLEALAAVLTGISLVCLDMSRHAAGLGRVGTLLGFAGILGFTLIAVPRLATSLGQRVLREKFHYSVAGAHAWHRWLAGVLSYLALWVAFGASLHFALWAVSGEPPTDILTSISAASQSWILGFIVVFVPTGLGIRELALSALLVSQSGLSARQADMVAVVSRFVLTLAELGWLLVGLVMSARRRSGSSSTERSG
ncbi:lysylphosphatidylglycerol synthase domain-containing protein [Chloroflexota bacterium]